MQWASKIFGGLVFRKRLITYKKMLFEANCRTIVLHPSELCFAHVTSKIPFFRHSERAKIKPSYKKNKNKTTD